MSSSPSQKHAVVFGASGITGWRVVKELLSYPTATAFASVTGVTNRPLTVEGARLPPDPRLRLVSGVDLTASAESVVDVLRARIPDVGEITHAYLYAYVDKPAEGTTMVEVNGQLVDNALRALKALAPRLEHVILQTGGKVYGAEHFMTIALPPTPWKESLPRVQDPAIAAQIFYYRQLDILKQHAEGASWRWTEIRPDAVIGFAPTSTAMNLALPLGIFLALWRQVHGAGAVVPYPGPQNAYARTHTETPMGASARFQIFASLGGEATHAQAFNFGAGASSYAEKWPLLAGEFGLVGVGPASEGGMDIAGWVGEHRGAWAELEARYGLKAGTVEGAGWAFLITLFIPFDREYDTSRSREVGFEETMDVIGAYREAWGLMAEAKLLPPL